MGGASGWGWQAALHQLGLAAAIDFPASRTTRVHQVPPDADEPPETASEMARRLGISRQLAHYRLRRQRRQGLTT
jgi:hypothetical protein